MATKRKREKVSRFDVLRELLSSSIRNHGSVEIALLHIMAEHDFDLSMLQQLLSEDDIDVSFSDVEYDSIAPFVALDACSMMTEIATFEVHRSRIPTTLFKTIVQDIDILLMQYGPPIEHTTAETSSLFLSPIFNRLVPLFGFNFRNLPESVIEDRTKGRVKYNFQSFGYVVALFIGFRYKTGSAKERLDAIAQIIAECQASDWNNVQRGFRLPVYGILCDGGAFEFFCFDGSTNPPSFSHGRDPTVPRVRLLLPEFTQTETTRSFLNALRPICEIIFDLMLNGYISSLKAYDNYRVENSARQGKPRESLDKAISSAHKALEMFRDAETRRQIPLIDEANAIVQEAVKSLKYSIDVAPIIRRQVLVMHGWDDEDVEKL